VTENYSNKCTTLTRVNEICDSMDTVILDNYHKTIEGNKSLEEKIQSNISTLKSDIDHNMIKVSFYTFITSYKFLSLLRY